MIRIETQKYVYEVWSFNEEKGWLVFQTIYSNKIYWITKEQVIEICIIE